MTPKVMLAGCSFTDPTWQLVRPWSVVYGCTEPSYIVAKVGMGIKGICTEVLCRLRELDSIEKLILILPTLWRMDLEMDEEGTLCNCMVDLVWSGNDGWAVKSAGTRKWITSGGLHYDRNTEAGKLFDLLYRGQGFFVILKEHIRALQMLKTYCDQHHIRCHVSAIQDPMTQLQGLDYLRSAIQQELHSVDYPDWFRFESKFIDEFLGHNRHPDDEEHKVLNAIIQRETI